MFFVLCRCGHRLDEPPARVIYQAGARARSGSWHVCKVHSPDNGTLPVYKRRRVLDISNLKCLLLFSSLGTKVNSWTGRQPLVVTVGRRVIDVWTIAERKKDEYSVMEMYQISGADLNR